MSPIVAIPVIAMLQLYPAAAQTSCIRDGEPFMSCSKPLVNACKRSVTVTYFDRLNACMAATPARSCLPAGTKWIACWGTGSLVRGLAEA